MWLAGWVVGKSDFNENPVVSLDLDLDFGLRLRVCQNSAELISWGRVWQKAQEILCDILCHVVHHLLYFISIH